MATSEPEAACMRGTENVCGPMPTKRSSSRACVHIAATSYFQSGWRPKRTPRPTSSMPASNARWKQVTRQPKSPFTVSAGCISE